MNQSIGVPEYILEESEKIHPTGNPQDCTNQTLLALEVDLVVLSGELKLLGNMSTRIATGIRNLRQLVEEV